MRIILASDSSYHLDFLPIASAGWKKFFPTFKISLVVVGNYPWKEYWDYCRNWVDTLHVVLPEGNYRPAAAAKMARLWIAGQFGHDVCTIHDIDFAPLQKEFYADKYGRFENGKIMTMGKEVYANNRGEAGKVPMSAMTAESFNFQQLANPECLSYKALFEKYKKALPKWSEGDVRELTDVESFSDESLCRVLLNRYGRGDLVEVDRGYNMWTETLDRAAWNPDREKLWAGGYIEAHMHKVNTDWERKRCGVVAEYLGVADAWQDGKHWTDISGQWRAVRVNAPDPNPEATAV